MAEAMGGSPLASVYATVSLDTSGLTPQLAQLKPALEAVSASADKMADNVAKVAPALDAATAAVTRKTAASTKAQAAAAAHAASVQAAASAFGAYASQTVAAVQATQAQAAAQQLANAAAAAALASYGGLGAATQQAAAATKQQATAVTGAAAAFGAYSTEAVQAYRAQSQFYQMMGATPAPVIAATKAKRDMGMAALQASRAIEDLQYGIAGVINNIPGIVQAMGGSSGMIAAISLGSVAAFQLGKYALPALADAMGLTKKETDPFVTALENVRARIDELKDKKIKLAVDRNELQAAEADLKRLTAAAEAYETARTGKSKERRDSDAIISEQLNGSGAAEALRRQAARDIEARDPALLDANDQLNRMQADFKERAERLVGGGNTDQQVIALQEQQLKVAQLRKQISDPDGPAVQMAGAAILAGGEALAAALEKAGRLVDAEMVRANTPEMVKRAADSKAEYEKTLADEQRRLAKIRQNPVGPGRREAEDAIVQEQRDDDDIFDTMQDNALSSGREIAAARKRIRDRAKARAKAASQLDQMGMTATARKAIRRDDLMEKAGIDGAGGMPADPAAAQPDPVIKDLLTQIVMNTALTKDGIAGLDAIGGIAQ